MGNVFSQSSSSGIVVYRQPPGNYVEVIEFGSIESANALTTRVNRRGGGVRTLQTTGIIRQFYYAESDRPISLEEATANHASIRETMNRFPAVAQRLEPIERHWANRVSFLKQRTKSIDEQPPPPAVSKAPPTSEATSSTSPSTDSGWAGFLRMIQEGHLNEAREHLAVTGRTGGGWRQFSESVASITSRERTLLQARATLEASKEEMRQIITDPHFSLRRNALGNHNLDRVRRVRSKYFATRLSIERHQRLCDESQQHLSSQLKTLLPIAIRAGESGAFEIAGAFGTLLEATSRRHQLELETDSLETLNWNTKALKAEVATERGKAAFQVGDLSTAAEVVANGLMVYPLSDSLLTLRRMISVEEKEVAGLASSVEQKMSANRFIEAADDLAKLRAKTPHSKRLGELEAALEKREQAFNAQLHQARQQEKEGQWKDAMEIYDALGLTEDYRLAAMRHGATLEAAGAYGEALDIYRLNDHNVQAGRLKESILAQANTKEAEGDYAVALHLFSIAGTGADLKRLQEQQAAHALLEGAKVEAGDHGPLTPMEAAPENHKHAVAQDASLPDLSQGIIPPLPSSVASAATEPLAPPQPQSLSRSILHILTALGLSSSWVEMVVDDH